MNETLMPPEVDRFPLAGRRTSVEPTRLLRSPGFTTQYPDIINPEILDPFARHAMEQTWRQRDFAERDLEVFHLRDVYATEECLILDRDLRAIENVSDVHTDEKIDQAVADIVARIGTGTLPHCRQGIVAKRRAAGNYGHFLMEMLSMAIVARRLYPDWDPYYWAHLAEPPLIDAMLRAFRLLHVPLDRVLLKPYRDPVFFANLLVIRGLTTHGRYMSPLAVEAIASMGDRIPPGAQRRIFVRRVPGWHGGRSLLNQDALCDRLAARGYDIIEPGSMALEEQIAAFRGARQIVGASGAAMTNIVFCEPGATVTTLVGSRVPDTFFWFIAAHRKLRYVEIRCQQEAIEGPEGWKADFSVAEEHIAYLETLTPDSTPPPRPSLAGTALEGTMIVAHVQDLGDQTVRAGERLGGNGPRQAIEGFAIYPSPAIPPNDIQYRSILGKDWPSPWMTGGMFCGSRGWHLPLFGVTIRLLGETARLFRCRYDASFADGTRRRGVPEGEDCVADPLAPLTSLTIHLEPRDAAAEGGGR